MIEDVERARIEALDEIRRAADAAALEAGRVKWLGRNGRVKELFETLKSAPPAEKPALGAALNRLKNDISAAHAERQAQGFGPVAADAADVTIPGVAPRVGRLHVLHRSTREIVDIFRSLGFSVASGPEVETEWYNFDALNTPPDHPSREVYDSFRTLTGAILRSQTSTVQIRVMENQPPPIRIVAPGRVYRPDEIDATHHPVFHQIEGLAVDEGITFADLKSCLALFARAYFGPETRTRFRPSFFPFTEPSAEMDVSCPFCRQKGCRVCKGSGWIEMLGCGMVDPAVFEAVKIDAERYTGFAFGFGLDRMCMMKHAIPDIRLLFENDLRFLEQLG